MRLWRTAKQKRQDEINAENQRAIDNIRRILEMPLELPILAFPQCPTVHPLNEFEILKQQRQEMRDAITAAGQKQIKPKAPNKRHCVTPSKRFRVVDRDGFKCQYCGATPGTSELHVDHIVPVCQGGTNEESNLITSCKTCNFGKSGKVYTATLNFVKETQTA